MAQTQKMYLGGVPLNKTYVGDIGTTQRLAGQIEITDQDVLNFITATGITDYTDKVTVNTLVEDFKRDAVWDKMVAIYPFIGGDATAHSYNLKDTGSYQISWNGNWVHDSNGITSDGSTTWGNTQLTIGSAIGTTFQSSGSLGMYSLTTGSTGYDMGADDAPGGASRQTALIIKFDGNDYFYQGLPVGASQYTGSHDGDGMYIASRTGNTIIGSIDGTKVQETTTATWTYLADQPLAIAAFNRFGGPEALAERTYAFAFVGTGLTETDHSNIYTAVQTYETSLGRNV